MEVHYLKMMYRMQKIYHGKIPWSEPRLQDIKRPDFTVNLNSFMVTIETYNTLINDLIKFTHFMIVNSIKKPQEDLLREYYIKSSRFYFVDKFIFASMFCDK